MAQPIWTVQRVHPQPPLAPEVKTSWALVKSYCQFTVDLPHENYVLVYEAEDGGGAPYEIRFGQETWVESGEIAGQLSVLAAEHESELTRWYIQDPANTGPHYHVYNEADMWTYIEANYFHGGSS